MSEFIANGIYFAEIGNKMPNMHFTPIFYIYNLLMFYLSSTFLELAKSWDAHEKSPVMILFEDGNPKTRLYEETFYLDIVAKIGKFCRPAGEEHQELK